MGLVLISISTAVHTWTTSTNFDLETLHVRDFTEPRFDEDMIDHLVMEPQRKRMLKALAKSFARIDRNEEALKGEPWTADFVQGKGHGLIFLLHGRPGVGKTCTAGTTNPFPIIN